MVTHVMERVTERLTTLGMPYMSQSLGDWLEDESKHEERTLLESLDSLVDMEWTNRQERQSRTRLKLSGMPQHKSLEDFDIQWPKGGLTEKRFRELCSLSWLERRENLVLMGPSGLGKTHLLLGLGYKACTQGVSVYYTSCIDLLDAMRKARDARNLKRKLAWIRKPGLLLIDEVGYENMAEGEANLFFQIVNARYETASIVLTTNRAFSGWGELMGDDAVATATIDRLLHHSITVNLKGNSYRMKGRLMAGIED